MDYLKFMVARKLCAAIVCAFLAPAALHGQDLRIEIMDVYTGHHYTLDPRSPFDVQGSATFSPDQKWVAFDANRKGESFGKKRLFITKANGSQQEPTDLVCGAMPSFSKDGKQIAYSSPDKGGGWVMDIDGENKRSVAGGWSIRFSPQDNDLVAYTVSTEFGQNIQLHNLETDDTRLLLPDNMTEGYKSIVWNFQWSRDGSHIVFLAHTHGDRKTSHQVVATVSTGEEPEHEIVTTEKAYCRVLFHPVKNEVFYSKRMPSKGTSRIFSIDLDVPEKFRTPVYLASQPDQRWNMIDDFSTDGSLIAFTSKPLPTESEVDSLTFAKKIRPNLGAIATLELSQTSLQRGDYASFVTVLMGELDQSEQKAIVGNVEAHLGQWTATINEAISRADKVKADGNSVIFPIDGRPENLRMVKENNAWVLAESQRRMKNAQTIPRAR